jgi:hypothetical protein
MNDVDAVRHLPPDDVDGEEDWERLTDEPDVRGVEATRGRDPEWPWSVGVYAMESVRDELLEGDVRHAMIVELWSVPGVTGVLDQDREVWIVGGEPSGDDLLGAAAKVVDAFADRIRVYQAGSNRGSDDATNNRSATPALSFRASCVRRRRGGHDVKQRVRGVSEALHGTTREPVDTDVVNRR